MNSIPGITSLEAGRLPSPPQKPEGRGPDFFDTLASAVGQVEALRQEAQTQAAQLLSGQGQDLHSALIAVQKAELAFELMMQVRNKIVNAYQEISRMNF